ncbi:Hsp70 family protein [Actinoplanes sp. HUAS TT8]|uniref:Hsp70 family protein n=1 Tax=Actinoplanes sp. HUAS TT8 TaxID=3447453 RepID=UPI003F5255BD
MSIDQGGPKYALGIDFGTSNTVAVARWPDGRARPILVDGSPLLPSAVYADAEGNLLVGRDAVHSARLEPARFEPNPKRRVDDGLVLLGEREFDVVDLITGVLARVVEEWHRAVGPYRPETTLTCPATWGAARRTLLAEAAARAGLSGARLVAEPVAAATYFAEVLGRDVPIGSVLMVHDFGAGTFDASLVSRTSTGFEVLAVDGRDDLGGLDVDAALVEHLRTDAWQRLLEPSTVEERRARRQLWDDVRIAKERLSRAQSADFVVPLLDVEVHLTRDELEQVARPVLEQTVRITQNLLKFADLPDGRLAGVFLVGGASRIPLMATLLHRELGEPPVVIEQPELVVAEGSVLAEAALLTSEPAAPGPTAQLQLPSQIRLLAQNRPQSPAPVAPSSEVSSPGGSSSAGQSSDRQSSDRQSSDGPSSGGVEVQAATQPVAAQSIPEAAGATEVAALPAATGQSGLPGRPGSSGSFGSPDSSGSSSSSGSSAESFSEPTEEGPVPSRAGGLPSRKPGAAVASAETVVAPAEAGPRKAAGAAVAEKSAAKSVDNRETEIRPELVVPPHMRPPVDPWPDADPPHWRPDPDATMPTSPPPHEGRTPVPRQGPHEGRTPARPSPHEGRTPPRQNAAPKKAPKPTQPVMAHARTVSPPTPVSGRVVSPSTPVSGRAVVAPPAARVAEQKKRKQKAPKPVRQQRPPKRRRNPFLRFLQVLLSILTMICVPLAALILAYGYGNGISWTQDAINVFNDIASLLHLKTK